MKPHETSSRFQSRVAGASGLPIAPLVGKVYDEATTTERNKILACLWRPLGGLAVFGVVNGAFAKVLFRNGQRDGVDRLVELGEVGATSDVTGLVDQVQALGAIAPLATARWQSARSRDVGVTQTFASSLTLPRGQPAAQRGTDTAEESDPIL